MTDREQITGPEIIAVKRHTIPWKLRIMLAVRRAVKDKAFGAAAIADYRARLGGNLPAFRAGAVDPIVLAACNELYYWRFGITLVLSLEAQGAPQAIHLHLAEPGPAILDHIGRLAAGVRVVTLTWTTDDCAPAAGLRYRTVYLTAMRFLVAPLILETVRRPVLCVDVDAIANRPIAEAYQPAMNADLAMIRRPEETSPSRKVRAGAVGFNPTPQGQRFASALSRALLMLLPQKPIYHIDQIFMHYLSMALERRGQLAIADLPPVLSDLDFGVDGALWMAKGWKTKEAGRYHDEKERIDALYPALSVGE